MLNIGTDSYATIEEANCYIAGHYLADSEILNIWNSTDVKSKEVLLRNSALQIDSLLFVGKKMYKNQSMQFPRTHLETKENGSSSDIATAIPKEVKIAQIENATMLLSTTNSKRKNEIRERIESGVKSVKLGDWAETYTDNASSIETTTASPLSNKKIVYHLRNWLNGTFRSVI